jgi:hypothetical protein
VLFYVSRERALYLHNRKQENFFIIVNFWRFRSAFRSASLEFAFSLSIRRAGFAFVSITQSAEN